VNVATLLGLFQRHFIARNPCVFRVTLTTCFILVTNNASGKCTALHDGDLSQR